MIEKLSITPHEQYAEGYWKLSIQADGETREVNIPPEAYTKLQSDLSITLGGIM